MGPFLVVCTCPNTITIDEHGVHYTITINQATQEPEQNDPEGKTPRNGKETEQRNQNPDGNFADKPAEEADNPHVEQQFVFDKIVRLTIKDGRTKLKIQWYGYTPEEDIIELAHHYPQNFIMKYWQRRRRSTNNRKISRRRETNWLSDYKENKPHRSFPKITQVLSKVYAHPW